MNSEKVKIFGWNELNKDTHTLFESEVERKYFSVIDELTTEVIGKRAVDQAYATGRWFLNHNEAKKAIMDELQSEINWRTFALEEIKKLKKKENGNT
jgi:ATP:corrinoid adenosyltransferase